MRPLTKKEESDVNLAFELYDMKGEGFITKDDALRAMVNLGYKPNKEDTFILSQYSV